MPAGVIKKWVVRRQAGEAGAPRSIGTVVQLQVAVAGYRPAIWRGVQPPAVTALKSCTNVIPALFGWDGDHL